MQNKTVELSGNIAVAASNKDERAALNTKNSMVGDLKLPHELLGKADISNASITILHCAAATSIQGSLCSKNAEARQKVLSFIKQQNATEQAARFAAAKISSLKNVNCNWVKIGAC